MSRTIFALPLVLLLLTSGCASKQQQTQHAVTNELATQIVLNKVAANGERLLCSQPSYLDCLQISEAQCVSEAAPHKEPCLEFAKGKVPQFTSGEDAKSFGEFYAMCMAVRQISEYGERSQEIGSCLQGARFDAALAERNLMQ